MNSIYFFLPFILVSSIGIYQDVFAVSTVTGYNYFDTTNPDGTHTWSTHEPYLLNNGEYVPFVYSNNQVITAQSRIILNPDGSYSFYQNNSLKFTDKIIAKYADVSNLNSWTYPNTLNNDTPDNSWTGSQFVSSKYKSGIGQLDYKYLLVNGKWKTQLEATNLSILNTKAFGFDQVIDLESDTIKFGGVTRNLDNFNGTTFDKTFLNNNKGKILDFLNGINFDFDLGFNNLYSVTVYDTGVGKSRLVFDYRTSTPLLPNEKLVIDPTFGYTAGTMRGGGRDTNCTGAYSNTTPSYHAGWDSGVCYVLGAYWDITSISDIATIQDVKVRYDVTFQTGGGVNNCDWKSYEGTMSTDTNTAFHDDIYIGGTTFVANDANCETVANNYILDLGTSADSDLQAELSVDNEWAVGVKGTSVTTDYADLADLELQVTYTTAVAPNRISDLTYANLGNTSVDLLWTQPGLNGGNLTNYLINYTSPYGTPTTFRANSTNTYLNVTGLTFATQYSFRVSALTEGGYNATGNILNITTTSTEFAVAPVLIANSYNSTKIDLIWTAPSMNNINGYRIEREDPIGSGWDLLVGNTSSTTLFYNNTGLTTNIIYNYRVYALNGSGISQVSNEYDMTTFHLPNAVTTLSGTATGFATVMLSWTEPVSYAPEIIGYQINYTSPAGNPITVITNNTGNDDTESTVENLQVGGDFSFRVAPLTIHGTNATGNIFNVTTTTNYNLGNLTNPDVTNENDFKIFFDRTDVDDTTILLDVTYPTAYVMNCEFSYKYSRDSQTYGPLTHTVVNSEEDKTTFQFNNVTNDIIDARCWDTATNDTGYYIITITDFELLNQIANLQNGTYGTEGRIGGIDIVTLIVIILGMIGFNRVTPIAGVIFTCVTVGITAYFGIIETYQIMFPIIALVVLLAYIRTRQD